jgi:predicted membrane channel-forming protein YqfA (hemolysin III family)
MKILFPIIALVGLALTIVPSLIHLFGTLELKATFNLMTVGMILWIVGGPPWLAFKKDELDKSTQDQI